MTSLQKYQTFIFQQNTTMSLFRIIGGKRVYAPKPDKYKHKKPKSKNPWSRNYDDSPEDNGGSFSPPQDYSQGYQNPYVHTPDAPVFDRPSVQDNEANLRNFMADSNKPPYLQNRWKKEKPQSHLFKEEKCKCEKEMPFEAEENFEVPYMYGKAYHPLPQPVWKQEKPIWEKTARKHAMDNKAIQSPFSSLSNSLPKVEDVLSNYSVTFDKIMMQMNKEGKNQKIVINGIESPISCEYGFICGENFGDGGEYKVIQNNGATKLGKQYIYPPNFIKGLPATIDYIAMKGAVGQKEGTYSVDLVGPMQYLLTQQNACIYLMFHTHPGDSDSFSGADILVPNLLVEDIRKFGDQRFYSVLENSEGMRFAIVTEDIDKYEKWSNEHIKAKCRDTYLDEKDGKSKEREIAYLSSLVLSFDNYFGTTLNIGLDSREDDMYYSKQIRAEAKKNNEQNKIKDVITKYAYSIITAITIDATDISPTGRIVDSGLSLYILVKKEAKKHTWEKITYKDVLKALKAKKISEKDFQQEKITIMKQGLTQRK